MDKTIEIDNQKKEARKIEKKKYEWKEGTRKNKKDLRIINFRNGFSDF